MKRHHLLYLFTLFTFLFITLFFFSSFEKTKTGNKPVDPPFLSADTLWVDSVMNQMTQNEKIGQLIMIAAYSNKDEKHINEILNDIKDFHVGGILFFQGDPLSQLELTNQFQDTSKTPLFIAIDGEWGLGMRLSDTRSYPYSIALGALPDEADSLIYQMGLEIGEQCKRIGININFAPVADINNNPDNPVIGFRSYGENRELVAKKTWLYARGMQDARIITTAKHFPGHGDTNSDSHKTLPQINHSIERLDSIELYPFKNLIKNGISGVMVAHLNVPALDPSSNLPSSLSHKITTTLLKDSLKFKGLIFSDAMNMKGVTKHFPPGIAEVKALQAGIDVLEMVNNPRETVSAIKNALTNGDLQWKDIDQKVRKILLAKKWLGLDKNSRPSTNPALNDLSRPQYDLTQRLITENSLTVLRNKKNLLPINHLDTLKIATLTIGRTEKTPFQKMASRYCEMNHFCIDNTLDTDMLDQTINAIKDYDVILAAIHVPSMNPVKNFKLTQNQILAVKKLLEQPNPNTVFSIFGNPYSLNAFKAIEKTENLIIAYQDNQYTQELTAQLIFGAIEAKGTLPVTVNENFRTGDGIRISSFKRLKYTIPEEIKIDSKKLETKLDSLVNLGIEKHAFPGCQILLAKDSKVFFHKCWGFHTYDHKIAVAPDDLYDWASLTKITGPLPILMQLYEQGKLNLDTTFSTYWPAWKGTDKEFISFKEVLSHQARLQPWIPFWYTTIKENGRYKPGYYRKRPSSRFNIRVANHLYLMSSYRDTIFNRINESELLDKKEYKYSDLSFYLIPEIIRNLTGEDYETYLNKKILKPLGASSVMFNPYRKVSVSNIIPTEEDKLFRKELLQGFVHDEGCAMMGGISGNAGLFGTIDDLSKIMQMYLNAGEYGTTRFVSTETFKKFTHRYFKEDENRRGLVFDKPYLDNQKKPLAEAYPAISASDKSFGHTGYTGTFTWADPSNNLLFIFFSNRVYPTRENNQLFDLNLRPELHQAVYDCMQ